MRTRKMRSLFTVTLILIFTFSLGLSAFAEGTTETSTSNTTTAPSTVTTSASTAVSAAGAAGPKAKVQYRQQLNQLKKAQHQVQIQTKQQQRLMAAAQFVKLVDQEVNRPTKAAQKKNVAAARIGIVKKIETADNGKIKILVQRGDLSKVFNVYFTFNIDPAKILVYDRPTKTQKALSDLKVGDVVRIIPVRGASLFLVDIIAHPATAPVTTTPDTLTVQ